jgi:hypothetical protein
MYAVVNGRSLAVLVCGVIVLAGCDLGLDDPSNRYEQLNIDTKELITVLRKISNEESANANLAELEEAAGKVRDTQTKIREAEEAKAEKGKGAGMGAFTNARQASLFQDSGDNARRLVEGIRNADPKAGVIVDNAVEGIEWPAPPPESAL